MAAIGTLDEERYVDAEDFRGPGALRRLYTAHDKLILGSASVVLFLAVWEWAGTSGAVNPLLSSSPSRIITTFQQLAQGELGSDVIISSTEFLYGFGLALLIGIPLGILMGWYRPVEGVLDPFVAVFNATPGVALMPLMIIWLGIGMPSKIAVIFLGAIFAILINTAAGVKNLDAALITAAQSFGASSFQIFSTIALPGSVPFILSGIRLGLGHALIGIVVGELYGASGGVGYLIAVAGMTFQTDKVLVGVVIIAVAGMFLTTVSKRIEDHFQSWRPVR